MGERATQPSRHICGGSTTDLVTRQIDAHTFTTVARRSWVLGLQWLGLEIVGGINKLGCGISRPCLPKLTNPAHTEYFREGDPFTEGIRTHDSIQQARETIAAQLGAGDKSNTVDFHYGDPNRFSDADREQLSGTTWTRS